MKPVLAILALSLTICIGLPRHSYGNCKAAFSNADTENSAIHHVDLQHPQLEDAIQLVLNLQKTLLVHPPQPDSEKTPQLERGFLVTEMSVADVKVILRNGGLIAACDQKTDTLAGYLLLSSLDSLEKYILEGELTLMIDSALWKYFFNNRRRHYIDQIAVHPDFHRSGTGTQLILAAKETSPHGLVADVLYKPFNNVASFTFFTKKHGFFKAGTLELTNYSTFGDLKANVLMWLPESLEQ